VVLILSRDANSAALTVIQTKLVNVSSEDIVNGSPTSTLALMWAVIQHWQVCHVSLVYLLFMDVVIAVSCYSLILFCITALSLL